MRFIGTEYARFCARLEREMAGLASPRAALLLARKAWGLVRDADLREIGILEQPIGVGTLEWEARLTEVVASEGRYDEEEWDEAVLRLMAATRAALLAEPQWNLGEAVVYAERFAPYWCEAAGPAAVAMWDGYLAYRGHGSYGTYEEARSRLGERPDIFRERRIEPCEVSIEEGARLLALMLQEEMATVTDVEHFVRARHSYDTLAGAGPMEMPWEEDSPLEYATELLLAA